MRPARTGELERRQGRVDLQGVRQHGSARIFYFVPCAMQYTFGKWI